MKLTSKGICPECGNDGLYPVLASKTYEVQGQRVTVEELFPWECSKCHNRVWPESEGKRARQVIAAKLGKAAA